MSIVIVDNGKGADKLAQMIRGKTEIVTPQKIPDADAYILSDGDMKHKNENIRFLEKLEKPVLAIGVGSVFLAMAYGAKQEDGIPKKSVTLKVEHSCPLLLDMKKSLVVSKSCGHGIDNLPENFSVIASSPKYPFEIIQEFKRPFFGVHFNPEDGGEGIKMIKNFMRFVEMWKKYHK